MRLTALKVKNAVAPGVYVDGEGLMLVVKSPTSRSWILRIQHAGKRRDYGIGSVRKITLAEAREKADKYRRDIVKGIDPMCEKRMARGIPTFQEAAILAHKELTAGLRSERHKRIWLGSLETYAFPSLGSTRIDLITPSSVVTCLGAFGRISQKQLAGSNNGFGRFLIGPQLANTVSSSILVASRCQSKVIQRATLQRSR